MTLEVLREEGLVYTQKEQHKVCDSVVFWVHTSSLLTYPKIECCKDTEYSSHTQNVVEVRYDIVGVVQRNVNSPVREHDSGKTSNGKQYQESQSKQHGSSQPQRTTIKSCLPAEDFNSSRDCNNHSGTGEIGTCVYIQAYGIHVVLLAINLIYSRTISFTQMFGSEFCLE